MSEATPEEVIASVLKEMKPFIQLGKMLKWLASIVLTLVLGIAAVAIWVNHVTEGVAANAAISQNLRQEMLRYESDHDSDVKAWRREFSEWKSSKDAIDVRIITTQEQITALLKRHQEFIEAHGWPDVQHPH